MNLVQTRNVQIQVPGLTLDDLQQGRFSAGRNVVGRNDDWDYTATLTLIFSDGQRKPYQCSDRNNCSASW